MIKMRFFRSLFFLLALSIGTVANAQSCFKFAQLTDLHISGAPSLEYLNASIEQINNDPSIDFVLITGDVTERGDNVSLENLAVTLKKFKKPYYTLTGNHETTWSESGLETFGRLFGSERISFTHKGYQFLGFTTGPFLRMAYGHVQPQDLSWVGQEVRSKGWGHRLILVTHYPLRDGDVDNWYQATDSLRRYNPLCMIGGHYHQNMALSYDGIPGFLGRSNLKDDAGHVGYTVYELTADSLLVYEQNIGIAPRHWAGLSLSRTYFDPEAKADKYPSFAVNQRWDMVQETWRIESGVGIYSTPVVKGKACYIGNTLGQMICYDWASGKEKWSFQGGGKIVGTPAVAKGVVVFGSTDHHIYGLSTKEGRLLWKIATPQAQMGCVSIKGSTAYIAGSDSCMRAIDVRSGNIKWQWNGLQGYVVSKPLLWDGKVIFGAWDNHLYALDQKTGEKHWTWQNHPGRMHYSPAGVWPVATDEAVFVVDPERAMSAIDLKSGKQLWRTKQSKVRESLGISADGERLYAKTMQDSIVCYAAQASHPQELWACDAQFGYEHATTMLVERDGVVYSSTKDGLIIAIEGKTGRLLWEHKVSNSFVNTVTPLSKGRVLLTGTGGEIVLLDASHYMKR